MKILVVSYFYYPENSPRAFRATELVNEFSRRGFEVDLIIPNKEVYKDISFPKNVNPLFVGELIKANNNLTSHTPFFNQLKSFLSKIKYFYLPFSFFKDFTYAAPRTLCKLNKKYDLIFSNSFPFVTHFVLYKAFKKSSILNQSVIKIAEYSDPFTYQKHKPVFFFYKWIEKRVVNYFDIISVPTDVAVSSYTHLKNAENIYVFPQAFNLSNVQLNDYKDNPIPTFAYAGMFYPGLRDPSFLFEYLTTLNIDFKFVIFTRFSNDVFISKYKPILGDKLQVFVNTTRNDVIKHLSSMDFLINIDNDSSNQVPSKLIDYAISKRPILSISKINFSESDFNKFLQRDYLKAHQIDLSKHDVSIVVDKMINTAKSISKL